MPRWQTTLALAAPPTPTIVASHDTALATREARQASWYERQAAGGVLQPGTVPGLLAGFIAEDEQRRAVTAQPSKASAAFLQFVAGAGSAAASASAADSASHDAVSAVRMSVRQAATSASRASRVAGAITRWLARVGSASDAWHDALDVLGHRGGHVAVDAPRLHDLAERIAALPARGRVTPSEVQRVSDEVARVLQGVAGRTRTLVIAPSQPAATLLEMLRGMAQRHLTSGAPRSAHYIALAELAASVLRHAVSDPVALEAAAHKAFVVDNDFAGAARRYGAVVSRNCARALCCCCVLLGDADGAVASMRASHAPGETIRSVREAAWSAALQHLAQPAVVAATFDVLRAKGGLTLPPAALTFGDAQPDAATRWFGALRQYHASRCHFDAARAVPRGVLAALEEALESPAWERALAIVARRDVSTYSRELAQVLVRADQWRTAARIDRPAAAEALWAGGDIDAACAAIGPAGTSRRFGEWMNRRPDSRTPAWQTALRLLGFVVGAGATPHQDMIVRTLEALDVSEAPAAAVDVLVQLGRTTTSTAAVELVLHAARSGATAQRSTPAAVTPPQLALAALATKAASTTTHAGTLRAAFDAAIAAGQWQGALELALQEMLPRGIAPVAKSTARLSTMLRARDCDAEAAHFEAAVADVHVRVFETRPRATPTVPPAASTTARVRAPAVAPAHRGTSLLERLGDAVNRRQWVAALRLVVELGEPPQRALSDVLRLTAQSQSWAATACLLSRFPRARSEATPPARNAAMATLAGAGRWAECFTLCAAMRRHEAAARLPQALTYCAKACRLARQWQGALRAFHAMGSRDGTFAALTEVIAACTGAGFPLSSVQLWLRVAGAGDMGVVLSSDASSHTLDTAIGQAVVFAVLAARGREAHGATWADSLQVLRRIAGRKPAAAVLSADAAASVMDTCTRAGRWVRAFDVLALQRRLHVPVNRHAVHMLMGCWRVGQWRAAVHLFTQAREEQAVDQLVRDRAVEALCSGGQWCEAVRLILLERHLTDHALSRVALQHAVPAVVTSKLLLRMQVFPVSRRHRLGRCVVSTMAGLEVARPDGWTATVAELTRLLKD